MRRLLPFATLALLACAPPTLTGTVFKGPIYGGELTALSMDRLDTTNTMGSIDLGGVWSVEAPSGSRFVQLRAHGSFFDEVTGDDVEYPVDLWATAEPGLSEITHINVLTHLADSRTSRLTDDMPRRDASARADEELVTALGIGRPGFTLGVGSSEIDPYGGDTPDAAYALAVSAILVSTWYVEAPATGTVDEVMFSIIEDFYPDGTLEPEMVARLAAGEAALSATAVRVHLEQFYERNEIDATVPAFEAMIDSDDDGSFADVDCDDHDPTSHPDATEICDAATADNDCDGLADDADDSLDLATRHPVYADLDHDSHGVPGTTAQQCHPAVGWADTSDDCDDTEVRAWSACATCTDGDGDGDFAGCDAYPTGDGPDCDDDDNLVFLGAPERCNGLTDDCAGAGTGLPPAEIDNDDDGYVECDLDVPLATWGNAESVIVIGGGDCDDAHATVYPGAPERCDGAFDDCADRVGTSLTAPTDETDDEVGGGDGFVECDRQLPWLGGISLQGGDCDDTDATVHPGAIDTFAGGDMDCDGSDLAAFVVSTVPAGSRPSSGLTSQVTGNRIGVATLAGGCARVAWLERQTTGVFLEDIEERCSTGTTGYRIDFEEAPPPDGPVAFPQAASIAWSYDPSVGPVVAAQTLCRYVPASDTLPCDQDFVAVTGAQNAPYHAVDLRARPDLEWWRVACGGEVALAVTGFAANTSTLSDLPAGACFLVPEADTFDVVLCNEGSCPSYTWARDDDGPLTLAEDQPFAAMSFEDAVTYGPILAARHGSGAGMTLWDFDRGAGWTLFEDQYVESVAARVHGGQYYVFARLRDLETDEATVVIMRGDPDDEWEIVPLSFDASDRALAAVDLLVLDEGVLLLGAATGSFLPSGRLVWSWNPFTIGGG